MRVAVLGTGIMGVGVTHSLLRAGHDVRVWNRTRTRAEPLSGDGASVAATAAEAVRDADAVLTLLFDADAVLDVAEEIAPALAGRVWIQAATIGVDGIDRVAELAQRRGLTVLDAPVLGTRKPAEDGTLVPLVSGDPEAVEVAMPVFDAIGAKTVRAGDRLGQGTALKLVCNAWIGTLIGGLAQSLALAERLGLDPRLFLEAIGGGAMDLPYAHAKAPSMLAREFPTSFAVDGVLKDLGLIREAARDAGVPEQLLAAVEELFRITAGRGYGGDDMAAVRAAFDPA